MPPCRSTLSKTLKPSLSSSSRFAKLLPTSSSRGCPRTGRAKVNPICMGSNRHRGLRVVRVVLADGHLRAVGPATSTNPSTHPKVSTAAMATRLTKADPRTTPGTTSSTHSSSTHSSTHRSSTLPSSTEQVDRHSTFRSPPRLTTSSPRVLTRTGKCSSLAMTHACSKK